MMPKRIIYLLLVLGLPLLTSANDDVQAFFDKGNAAYKKANYAEAVKAYQQILNEGYQSATVYFNLGNAYYKADDIPAALLYYEKAHKMVPGDEDISFNIQLANLKTTDKIEAKPDFFLQNWWKSFILFFSINTIAVISVLFWIAGFLTLSFYIFANTVSLKRTAFYSGFVLIILGFCAMFIANRQSVYYAAHHQGIIFSSSVTAKSEPVNTSKSLFVIHEGAKVDVLDNNNGWMKIRLANGNEGWITVADAKEI